MRLSANQREAVSHPGHVALTACPGSGKTRTLVAKIAQAAEEVQGTPRHVAAITYTRAASFEAEARLSALLAYEDQPRVEIGTIHAFCLKNILGKFYWRLPDWREGFSIAAPDTDEYKAAAVEVAEEHGINAYKAMEKFELLNRAPDGTPIFEAPLTEGAALAFWERLAQQGMMDFSGLLYACLQILNGSEAICRGLSSRFAWILVDEFQDTSEVQLEILLRIAACDRTRFFIVGDPNQSIFHFAGARPEFMSRFANSVDARTDLSLTENWRSSSNIVQCANALIQTEPPMIAEGPAADDPEEPQWCHVTNDADPIQDIFLPKVRELDIPLHECAILGPWFWPLFQLGRELREAGVPVIGPGARPYKRRHLIAPLAECVAAYVEATGSVSHRRLRHELKDMLMAAIGNEEASVEGRQVRRALQRVLRLAKEIHYPGQPAVEWLQALPAIVSDSLVHYEIAPPRLRALLSESVDAIAAEIRAARIRQPDEIHVGALAQFVDPRGRMRLLTVHKAKGREFSALAVMDVHEGRFPFFNAGPDEVEQGRRLFYVALTRAERVLMLFTNSRIEQNPSRYLREAGITRWGVDGE